MTECVYNNGAAGVFSSRNVPNSHANQRLLLTGVTPGNGSIHENIMACKFVLSRVRNVNEFTYDLSNPFYIIAATGPAFGSKFYIIAATGPAFGSKRTMQLARSMPYVTSATFL